MVQAEGKRSCRATVRDERTESSWEPAGLTKVSRRDDGTLTLRALLVKAVAVGFWPDSSGPPKSYVRLCPLRLQSRPLRRTSGFDTTPPKSSGRFDHMWMHHRS